MGWEGGVGVLEGEDRSVYKWWGLESFRAHVISGGVSSGSIAYKGVRRHGRPGNPSLIHNLTYLSSMLSPSLPDLPAHTRIVGPYLQGSELTMVNLGDSRCVMAVGKGKNLTAVALTEDHKCDLPST